MYGILSSNRLVWIFWAIKEQLTFYLDSKYNAHNGAQPGLSNAGIGVGGCLTTTLTFSFGISNKIESHENTDRFDVDFIRNTKFDIICIHFGCYSFVRCFILSRNNKGARVQAGHIIQFACILHIKENAIKRKEAVPMKIRCGMLMATQLQPCYWKFHVYFYDLCCALPNRQKVSYALNTCPSKQLETISRKIVWNKSPKCISQAFIFD